MIVICKPNYPKSVCVRTLITMRTVYVLYSEKLFTKVFTKSFTTLSNLTDEQLQNGQTGVMVMLATIRLLYLYQRLFGYFVSTDLLLLWLKYATIAISNIFRPQIKTPVYIFLPQGEYWLSQTQSTRSQNTNDHMITMYVLHSDKLFTKKNIYKIFHHFVQSHRRAVTEWTDCCHGHASYN